MTSETHNVAGGVTAPVTTTPSAPPTTSIPQTGTMQGVTVTTMPEVTLPNTETVRTTNEVAQTTVKDIETEPKNKNVEWVRTSPSQQSHASSVGAKAKAVTDHHTTLTVNGHAESSTASTTASFHASEQSMAEARVRSQFLGSHRVESKPKESAPVAAPAEDETMFGNMFKDNWEKYDSLGEAAVSIYEKENVDAQKSIDPKTQSKMNEAADIMQQRKGMADQVKADQQHYKDFQKERLDNFKDHGLQDFQKAQLAKEDSLRAREANLKENQTKLTALKKDPNASQKEIRTLEKDITRQQEGIARDKEAMRTTPTPEERYADKLVVLNHGLAKAEYECEVANIKDSFFNKVGIQIDLVKDGKLPTESLAKLKHERDTALADANARFALLENQFNQYFANVPSNRQDQNSTITTTTTTKSDEQKQVESKDKGDKATTRQIPEEEKLSRATGGTRTAKSMAASTGTVEEKQSTPYTEVPEMESATSPYANITTQSASPSQRPSIKGTDKRGDTSRAKTADETGTKADDVKIRGERPKEKAPLASRFEKLPEEKSTQETPVSAKATGSKFVEARQQAVLSARKDVKDIETKLESKRTEIKTLQKTIQENQSKIADAKNFIRPELRPTNDKKVESQKQIKALDDQNKKLNVDLKQAETEVKKLETDVGIRKNELQRKEALLNTEELKNLDQPETEAETVGGATPSEQKIKEQAARATANVTQERAAFDAAAERARLEREMRYPYTASPFAQEAKSESPAPAAPKSTITAPEETTGEGGDQQGGGQQQGQGQQRQGQQNPDTEKKAA